MMTQTQRSCIRWNTIGIYFVNSLINSHTSKSNDGQVSMKIYCGKKSNAKEPYFLDDKILSNTTTESGLRIMEQGMEA